MSIVLVKTFGLGTSLPLQILKLRLRDISDTKSMQRAMQHHSSCTYTDNQVYRGQLGSAEKGAIFSQGHTRIKHMFFSSHKKPAHLQSEMVSSPHPKCKRNALKHYYIRPGLKIETIFSIFVFLD